MARPHRSTPVGAWYNGYAGMKRLYDPFFSYCPNQLPHDNSPRVHSSCGSAEIPANPYEREGFLFDTTEKDRASPTMATQYYDKTAGSQSYRPPGHHPHPHPHHHHHQDGRVSSWEQTKGREEAKDDLRLYDTKPTDDFKPLYEPSPRNGPDFKPYEPSPRNGLDFKPYDSSPRNGPGDAKGYEVTKYNGPGDREWGDLGRTSPRKVTYEPSFHDPGASPRKISPWDGGYQRSPRGEGQGRYEGAGGQGQVLDPLMTKVATGTKQVTSRQAGSVFLFMRFHVDCFAKIGQTCQSAITKDLRGEYIGIADKVFDFGDMSGKNRCGYAVFQLPSLASAEVFYNRDKLIRQHDFPPGYGDTEVFAINLQTDPGIVKFYQTFLLSEITLNDGPGADSVRSYEDWFVAPFSRLLQRHEALPYAAFCNRDNRKTLKRRYFERNDLITLHLFRSLDHFEQVRADPEYTELRGIHNTIAKEKCSLFTVRHVYCP